MQTALAGILDCVAREIVLFCFINLKLYKETMIMRKVLNVVLFIMLMILFVGCSGGDNGSSSTTESNKSDSMSSNVSASGGSIETPSGEAGLAVPAGALSENKSITVSLIDKVTPPGHIAGAYDFTPDGQTFATPVTISIKYDPDKIPDGVTPSDLRLALLSANGEWEIIEDSTVDTANQTVSGPTSHFSTYSVVVHDRKKFGEQTGEFNSVIAYSNGSTGYTSGEYNSSGGYNTGMKWLCDEYVNRYYKQIYEKEIRIEGRNASDYYQNAAARGLTAYPNDGSEQPQVGDILVSEYGEYGHVAIVREVQHNKIFVIQQNWSDNGADNRYPITKEGNHVYPFDGKKGDYEIKGWLRCPAQNTYRISGTVSGAIVSGVTITLTGASSNSTTTDASGNYTFTGLANGSYTITASKTGYSFSPASINATVNYADVTGQNFTATANSTGYTITGHVNLDGAGMPGVTVTLTGAGSASTVTDAKGSYTFTNAANGSYVLNCSAAGYIFDPSPVSIEINGADYTVPYIIAASAVYTISGTVSGDVVSGVTVTLTGTGSTSTTTDASGNYSFSGALRGSYTITASKTGYIVSPTSISAVVSNADLTNQNFTATAVYNISGTVSGDVVSGVTITLAGDGSNSTTTDADGNYSFSGAISGSYTITASMSSHYNFSPVSISATVSNADLTDQNFTATAIPWVQKTDVGGTARVFAVAFSIGNKGYIVTGCSRTTCYKDTWEYDPASDIWTQRADFGGSGRPYATGFSIGSKGYLGTGTTSFSKDFWEYDSVTNKWTQKADFGGFRRSGALGFSIGSKGYIGMGGTYDGSTYAFGSKDLWEYDPATDIWVQKADFSGLARSGAVGFSIGNKGYVGMGNTIAGGTQVTYTDFWEYDPVTNIWTRKADGKARMRPVCFSVGNKGYVGLGFNNEKDFWEYDPAADTWIRKTDFSGIGRDGAVGFSIGNKGYAGTGCGNGSNIYYKDIWEYDPAADE
jgi:N-acetylneuraminic acid mutarotase/surface antigen